MRTDTFWAILDRARADVTDPVAHPEEVAAAVVDDLVGLPVDDIVGFRLVFDDLLTRSYRWDLWAAADLVNGGCSDDGFDYFRGWLLAQGRTVWEAALADPDSLADLLPADRPVIAECEDLYYVAAEAFAQVTGEDPGAFDDLLTAREDAEAGGRPTDQGPGEEFDLYDDAELRARLPRLSARFLPAPPD